MLIALGLLVLIIIGGTALVGLWFVQKLRAFETLTREVGAAYDELNAEFPFVPPPKSKTVEPERLSAYLRVHQEWVDRIPAREESLARSALNSGSFNGGKMIRLLQIGHDFIKSSSQTHQAALKAESMSLNEYLWIHGLVLCSVFQADQPGEREETLNKTMAGLKRLAESNKRLNAKGFGAEELRQGLNDFYKGYEVIPADALEKFDTSRSLGVVIDLLAANREVTGGDAAESRSLGQTVSGPAGKLKAASP